MHLLCATHTRAPVGALSAQISKAAATKRICTTRHVSRQMCHSEISTRDFAWWSVWHAIFTTVSIWGTSTQNPKPGNRNPEPGTRKLRPRTRAPTLEIINAERGTRNMNPETRNPEPENRNWKPGNPRPGTKHLEPENRNWKPGNPRPETRIPKPETRNPDLEARNPTPDF